jgi:hypothetical protein
MNANDLSKPFTDRSNCRRAAKRECGDAFEIERVEGGFAFRRPPETRFPGAAKAIAEETPGLKRLRASSVAIALRVSAIADQTKEMTRQAEKMASVNIENLTPASHPIAAANAESWPKGKATAKAANLAKIDKPATAKELGKRAAILAAAQAGALPTPPDFSAATHARFRGKLAELTKLAEAGDIEGLKAYAIKPVSSSPKALDRYRNLCVLALEARMTAAAA